MILAVALLGATLAALGMYGIVRPAGLVRLVETRLRSPSGLYFAIGVRVALGLLLLATASESRFPQTFRVLGGLSLAAAVILPFIGLTRLLRIVQWIGSCGAGWVRVGSLIGSGFGAFLIYAVA